jgi:ABC-type transport system involved in multi-copper enzyme maturation permease subunit
MSAITPHVYTSNASLAARARPSFVGLVRGELLKLSRQWMTWIILVLYLGGTTLLFLLLSSGDSTKNALAHDKLSYLYIMVTLPSLVMRIFGGIFLIIITAYLVGLEYQSGTIRIILARGIGRVQFFLAQLTTALLVVVMLFVGWTLVNVVGMGITTLALGGSLDVIQAANADFWREIGIYALTILMSMTLTVLMTATVTVVGRSLAFGMSVGLAWFAVDNLLALPMMLIAMFLHQDWPKQITGYLLGLTLNIMPKALDLKHVNSIASTQGPLIDVGSTQVLLVTLGYAVGFLLISLVLTWKKDVKE